MLRVITLSCWADIEVKEHGAIINVGMGRPSGKRVTELADELRPQPAVQPSPAPLLSLCWPPKRTAAAEASIPRSTVLG